MGPPVQRREDLTLLIEMICTRIEERTFYNIQIRHLDGPVPYKAAWRSQRQPRGMSKSGVHLWVSEVDFGNATLYRGSFTVIVSDQAYFGVERQTNRQAFETFVVSAPEDGRVDENNFFQRLMQDDSWGLRERWETEQATAGLEAGTITKLQASVWHGLLDLPALFPHAGSQSRRKGGRSVRLDTILPTGLASFLADLAPRPPSFERLCQEL